MIKMLSCHNAGFENESVLLSERCESTLLCEPLAFLQYLKFNTINAGMLNVLICIFVLQKRFGLFVFNSFKNFRLLYV